MIVDISLNNTQPSCKLSWFMDQRIYTTCQLTRMERVNGPIDANVQFPTGSSLVFFCFLPTNGVILAMSIGAVCNCAAT